MKHSMATVALGIALVVQPMDEAGASVYGRHAVEGQARLAQTIQGGPTGVAVPATDERPSGAAVLARARTLAGEALRGGGGPPRGAVRQAGRAGLTGTGVRGRRDRITELSLPALRSAR
jgi:hypothetical protein